MLRLKTHFHNYSMYALIAIPFEHYVFLIACFILHLCMYVSVMLWWLPPNHLGMHRICWHVVWQKTMKLPYSAPLRPGSLWLGQYLLTTSMLYISASVHPMNFYYAPTESFIFTLSITLINPKPWCHCGQGRKCMFVNKIKKGGMACMHGSDADLNYSMILRNGEKCTFLSVQQHISS